MTDVLESVRRGEVVRVVSNNGPCETESSGEVGHLVLAAEKASTEALTQLLQFANGIPVFATTRDRLEQLCRYLLRPPIAQERLALGPDGRILVTLKLPWRDGTTHLSTA